MKHSILILLLVTFTACGGCGVAKPNPVPQQQANRKFSMPEVPAILTTPEQKAEFIVTHYWDNYDFADTTLISNADVTEQGFADFINILSNVPLELATRGIDTLMARATVNGAMYAHFSELSERYLYHPNSPFRNDGIYIAVLRSMVANPKQTEIEKSRPQFQLDMALKNRVGHKATDFTYTIPEAGKAKLYDTKANKILLFFFLPDCHTCKATKQYVAEKGIDKLVKIVWVNPDLNPDLDTLYDLRASPTLYLLDKDKTVLLKNASIEQIEQYLLGIEL